MIKSIKCSGKLSGKGMMAFLMSLILIIQSTIPAYASVSGNETGNTVGNSEESIELSANSTNQNSGDDAEKPAEEEKTEQSATEEVSTEEPSTEESATNEENSVSGDRLSGNSVSGDNTGTYEASGEHSGETNRFNGSGNDNAGINTKFGEAGYFVVGANRLVEENAKVDYQPLTDNDHELFSAFYNDITYERQGGKWFRGYDVIRYGADSTKVYDRENYSKLVSENSAAEASPLAGNDLPSSIGEKGDMVFLLDKMPVELSGQFKLLLTTYDENGNSVYNYRNMDPAGMKLYAWEYELDQSDGRYYRVGVTEIAPEDYELYTEEGEYYTNIRNGEGSSYIVADTVKGAVRVGSEIANDVSNPIAIVAMVYDAGAGGYEAVENLTEDDFSLIWDNDIVYHTLKESVYAPDNNNYLDDMYSAAAMGSFSLDVYWYYKD